MKIFQYCPSCGSNSISFDGFKKFCCDDCRFTYYHNVAAGVAVVLEYGDKIVVVRRGNDPGRGMLDLPGGFIDPNESAEDALRREVREELSIDVGGLSYITSSPNVYEYKGIIYNTCDVFFYSKIEFVPTSIEKSEIEELILLKPSDIRDEQIAFESVKACLRHFRKIKPAD